MSQGESALIMVLLVQEGAFLCYTGLMLISGYVVESEKEMQVLNSG